LLSERDKPVKALGFLIEKPSLSQKFENLEGAELLAFTNEQAKKFDLKLGTTAAQFLATVYAGNSWALVTELEKLSAFASTKGHAIEKNDLDAFDLEAAPNYWGLLNGMKSPDGRIRLATLEKLFSIGDPAPKIFNILAAQAGSKTPRMAAYDLAVKSGKMDYEEALVDMVLDG
jgi:DNA polymerase III delta subunit